ncbi:MAG: cytochrome c/FTR1 family iron permease, partial [Myxococcaceae bacterium]
SRSEFEMQEQRVFIEEALSAAKGLGSAGSGFVPRIESLQARILKMEDTAGVSRDCGQLIEDLVLAGGLARSPRHVPDLERGKELYAANCAVCHAADGSGNAPIAATMEPKPANFLDGGLMGGLTPYKAFNTTGFGIAGTPMPGFAKTINEEDRWALSFFVLTMRHAPCDFEEAPRVSLEKLATSTDDQLAAEFGAHMVACLRHNPPKPDEEQQLLMARSGVEDAMRLAMEGDATGARQALLDAYLLGVEPVEPLLTARDAGLVRRIEASVLQMRMAIEQKSPEAQDHGRELLTILDQARRAGGNTSAFAVFWVALLILLREGFEAMVVVGALLAVLKRMNATHHARVVHYGWVSALVVGAIAFVFGQKALAGANREWLEGIIALIAVGMLLYAALWLNARSNISAFMKELRAQMEGALGRGSMAGLFLIAFSAVLRESFETALFLQGLSIDSASGTAWGAAAGLVALTALVIAVNRVGYRLPMKSLFRWSTVLLFATAVMLLGKGLHALQEVGVVTIRPIPMITIDFLGIYPDLVSLLPQLLLALSPLAWNLIRRRGQNDDSTTVATAE